MRLYIKGDYSKRFPYGYLELAGEMWFPEEEQKSYSNAGNNDSLQEDLTISLMFEKSFFDKQWNSVPLKNDSVARYFSHTDEWICLDFENAYLSDYREKGDNLEILTSHLELLTVDRRALYIMAIEVATAIDGWISEDDKETWLTANEFKKKHQDILSLSFQEAHDMSLKEISYLDTIDEPLWEELDKKREAYIKIHGEVV